MARLTPDLIAQKESALPPAEVTRQRVRDYIRRADMSLAQFYRMSGYSVAAGTAFLADRYQPIGSDVMIREKFETAMKRFPVGVALTAARGKLYETENVRVIRRWFHHCSEHRALAYVYAAPGEGKSFGIQHVIADFNRSELTSSNKRAYLVYASINIRPRDLIAKICAAAGAPAGNSLQSCMTALRNHLRGTQVVLVIDEAQHCTVDAFEALRELHDTDPEVGILLMGSHKLRSFFRRNAGELEQWNSRMDAGEELPGMSEPEAIEVIAAELPQLNGEAISLLIGQCRVRDPHSRDKQRTYISQRRVFKAIAATQADFAAATPDLIDVPTEEEA